MTAKRTCGYQPRLTRAQAEDVIRRYRAYIDNAPSKIAADYGLSKEAILRYARGQQTRFADDIRSTTTRSGTVLAQEARA